MLNIETTKEGNLRLSIPDSNDRAYLAGELENDRPELYIYADLLEPYFCNGSYSNISPEVYPLGLTSDPYILSEDMTIEDNGDATIHGGLWHYPNYMIKSLVRELVEGNEVILYRFYDTPGRPERLIAFYNSRN